MTVQPQYQGTPRQKYTREYNDLVDHRQTLAFKAMGTLSALVAMDVKSIEGDTFTKMKQLVHQYDKATQDIEHIWLLLELMDHDDSSGEGSY
jgi:hypothetical protein